MQDEELDTDTYKGQNPFSSPKANLQIQPSPPNLLSQFHKRATLLSLAARFTGCGVSVYFAGLESFKTFIGAIITTMAINTCLAFIKAFLDGRDLKKSLKACAPHSSNTVKLDDDALREAKARLQLRKLVRGSIPAVPLLLLFALAFYLYAYHQSLPIPLALVCGLALIQAPAWLLCMLVDLCLWAPLARWQVD